MSKADEEVFDEDVVVGELLKHHRSVCVGSLYPQVKVYFFDSHQK